MTSGSWSGPNPARRGDLETLKEVGSIPGRRHARHHPQSDPELERELIKQMKARRADAGDRRELEG